MEQSISTSIVVPRSVPFPHQSFQSVVEFIVIRHRHISKASVLSRLELRPWVQIVFLIRTIVLINRTVYGDSCFLLLFWNGTTEKGLSKNDSEKKVDECLVEGYGNDISCLQYFRRENISAQILWWLPCGYEPPNNQTPQSDGSETAACL